MRLIEWEVGEDGYEEQIVIPKEQRELAAAEGIGTENKHINWVIFKFTADTRKMSFRYSVLCGMAYDAVGAVKLGIPEGFNFLKFKLIQFLKNIVELTISKIWNAQFGKQKMTM